MQNQLYTISGAYNIHKTALRIKCLHLQGIKTIWSSNHWIWAAGKWQFCQQTQALSQAISPNLLLSPDVFHVFFWSFHAPVIRTDACWVLVMSHCGFRELCLSVCVCVSLAWCICQMLTQPLIHHRLTDDANLLILDQIKRKSSLQAFIQMTSQKTDLKSVPNQILYDIQPKTRPIWASNIS